MLRYGNKFKIKELYLMGHAVVQDFACCLFHVGFLLGLFFNPENGGEILL
jgi:hypothetical protein